jgi:four helix bundle protein
MSTQVIPKRDIVPRTLEFAVRVVKFCRRNNRVAGTERAMWNQLLKSGTSIGANVEEAQSAESRADFIHKNSIAVKEAREARYWLKLFRLADVVKCEESAALLDEADQLYRILSTVVARSKENTKKKSP